jgi:agmatinase
MSNAGPVQLIGVPTDVNSSHLRGAAEAPPCIRRALHSLGANLATEDGRELGAELPLEDLGDLELEEAPGDHELIVAAARAAAARGPLLALGGDHAITFPLVEGLAAVHGPLAILHFDAHPDLYHDFGGNPRSHASPFARILERNLASRLVQVGIRATTPHLAAQIRRFGVEIVPWTGFSPDVVPLPHGPLYVSIDLDALDPAFAPGVSHPEPGGLSVRDILATLQRIRERVVGADVVECNPSRDVNGLTACVAAKLVKELAAVMIPSRA